MFKLLLNLPITYKRKTVALLRKNLTLSEPEFYAKNFELLKAMLKRNLYPKGLVDNIIEMVLRLYLRLK